MEQSFTKFCRCCLSQPDPDELRNMIKEEIQLPNSESSKGIISAYDGYLICSGMSYDEFTLTKDICNQCTDKLNSSYLFYMQCRTSNEVLRENYGCLPEIKEEKPEDELEELNIVYNEVSDTNLITQVFVNDFPPMKKIKPNENEQQPRTVLANKQTPDEVVLQVYEEKQKEPDEKIASLKDLTSFDIGDYIKNLEKGLFICFFCDEFSTSYAKYILHRQTRHTFDRGPCKVSRLCHLCKETTKGYVKHLTDIHPDYKPNQCDYCQKTFRHQLELRNHLYLHVKLDYKCMACGLSLKTQKALRSHIAQTQHSNNYSCPYCGQEFSTVLPMLEHTRDLHKKEKIFPCFKCKWVSVVKSDFDVHKCDKVLMNDQEMEETKAKKEHACELCHAVFYVEDHLVVHSLTVCEVKEKFFCGICIKDFPSKMKLYQHNRLHLLRSFICDMCGFCTTSDSMLKKHQVMHQELRPHKCQRCESSFKRRSELVRHQEVHSESQYECSICGKKFRSQLGIKTHMATHLPSLKKHPCEICGKKFSTGRDRKIHFKIHTDRPFKCSMCPADFHSSNCLNNHYKAVHGAESCYECKLCQKTLSCAGKLRKHMFVHRDYKKPYQCPECLHEFIKRDRFKNHLKKYHNIDYDETVHGYKEIDDMKEIIASSLKVHTDGIVPSSSNLNNLSDHVVNSVC